MPQLHHYLNVREYSGKVFVLLVVFFVEAMFNTMLYPFVAYMVHDFWKNDLDDNDPDTDNIVSFYAGFVASCFSFAQFASSFLWGYVSDKIGRRPVILIGMLGNVITAPLFGLAPTYNYALLFRSLSGLLNGNVGVAKAYAREISDDTNCSKIFSLLGFSWGIGVMIGPMLGGFLSHPTRRLPQIFVPGGFWDTYPYLLPMLFNSVISLIGLVIGIFSIQEVPKKPSRRPRYTITILKNTNFTISTAVYAISGLAFLGFQEVFPFWCKTRVANGGLGWEDESSIGMIQSAGGVSVIFFQLLLVPMMVKDMGILYTMKLFWCICIPNFIAISFMNNLSGAWLWTGLIVCYVIFAAVQGSVLTSIGIAVNNSVTRGYLGAANGIAQASVSLFRAIGPAAFGIIYGWSTNNGLGYPLDSHLLFLLVSLLGVICVVLLQFGLGGDLDHRIMSPEPSPEIPLLSLKDRERESEVITLTIE